MLDRFMLNVQEKQSYFKLISIVFVICVVLSFVNSFIGGHSLFLVALISLTLSFPLTNYARKMEREDIEKAFNSNSFFRRYEKELLLFWVIFLGVLIGLYVSSFMITDFSYQQTFLTSIKGDITAINLSFGQVLFNNLKVAFFTFIISFFVYSGLIFIIVWNASILTYYLYSYGSLKLALMNGFLLLFHGLFEVGGYVFAGIAGAILAYRLDFAYSSRFYKVTNKKGEVEYKPDRRNMFQKIINKRFFIDFGYLVTMSIVFILCGAFLEFF